MTTTTNLPGFIIVGGEKTHTLPERVKPTFFFPDLVYNYQSMFTLASINLQ